MIEVFDAKRTRSYGCFASFKAATDTLDSLAATGQLGSVPAVSVAAYCSGADVPRRVSRPFEPQLSALGGQPETVQPEMQNLYAIIKTQ